MKYLTASRILELKQKIRNVRQLVYEYHYHNDKSYNTSALILTIGSTIYGEGIELKSLNDKLDATPSPRDKYPNMEIQDSLEANEIYKDKLNAILDGLEKNIDECAKEPKPVSTVYSWGGVINFLYSEYKLILVILAGAAILM